MRKERIHFHPVLHERMLASARSSSRTLQEQIVFDLEVMFIVVSRERKFRSYLRSYDPHPLEKNTGTFFLSEDLYDFYFQWAGELGIKIGTLLRIVLWNIEDYYRRMVLVPEGCIITKEVLINLILEDWALKQLPILH